jgi:hypothetical protein
MGQRRFDASLEKASCSSARFRKQRPGAARAVSWPPVLEIDMGVRNC